MEEDTARKGGQRVRHTYVRTCICIYVCRYICIESKIFVLCTCRYMYIHVCLHVHVSVAMEALYHWSGRQNTRVL